MIRNAHVSFVVALLALAVIGLQTEICQAQEVNTTEPGAALTAGGETPIPAGGGMPVPDADGDRGQVEEIMDNLGALKYPLLAISVLTLAFIIYFIAVLRAGQVVPRRLHRRLIEHLRAGELEDARKECERRRCPLAYVALSAINYMRQMPDPDPTLLKDIIEGEGARQAETIQGQTLYLLDIAAIAPMMGLLGTVFGMVRAFGGVAEGLASAKPIALAGGVSQALYTTAFGLIIGIFAMLFYAMFRRMAAKLISHLEAASIDVLTAFMGRSGFVVGSKM